MYVGTLSKIEGCFVLKLTSMTPYHGYGLELVSMFCTCNSSASLALYLRTSIP